MSAETRDRGMLSDADRAYLRGDATHSSVQAERNARARIRNRLFHAFRDFELLVEHLPAHDRSLVFDKRVGELDGRDAFDGFVSAFAFLYQAVGDTELDVADVLAEAVNVAEARQDRAATVEFDVTYHALSADELLRKLRSGESLSLTEIAFLHRSDDVPDDELALYLAEDEDPIEDGRIQAKVTNF